MILLFVETVEKERAREKKKGEKARKKKSQSHSHNTAGKRDLGLLHAESFNYPREAA